MRTFRVELSKNELLVLKGALSNKYPGVGNEILNNISEGIENALSEHPLFDGKVKELKTVNHWCIRLGIRLHIILKQVINSSNDSNTLISPCIMSSITSFP